MKSMYAYTDEIDDLDLACEQLADQLKKQGPFLSNTCGIVFCDYEVDTQVLTESLKKKFPFPFIGATSVGSLSKTGGYSELSISLLVLTGDDVNFRVGMTRDISTDEEFIYVGELYEGLTWDVKEKEKFIIALASSGDANWNFAVSDDFVKILDEVSGGVPVLGGCAADAMSFERTAIFHGKKVVRNGIALILVYGNVKPIFRTERSVSTINSKVWKVTKSSRHSVYELDGVSVGKQLMSIGLAQIDNVGITRYLSSPFVCSEKTKDGDEIDILRSLAFYDKDNDFCNFLGNVEEGSNLAYGLISREEVEKSVTSAFDHVLGEIEKEKDYRYSTIICISCVARYCVIIGDKMAEARTFMGRIPENINLTGFYSFGEFCPQFGKKSGNLYNAINNETFVIVAF